MAGVICLGDFYLRNRCYRGICRQRQKHNAQTGDQTGDESGQRDNRSAGPTGFEPASGASMVLIRLATVDPARLQGLGQVLLGPFGQYSAMAVLGGLGFVRGADIGQPVGADS